MREKIMFEERVIRNTLLLALCIFCLGLVFGVVILRASSFAYYTHPLLIGEMYLFGFLALGFYFLYRWFEEIEI